MEVATTPTVSTRPRRHSFTCMKRLIRWPMFPKPSNRRSKSTGSTPTSQQDEEWKELQNAACYGSVDLRLSYPTVTMLPEDLGELTSLQSLGLYECRSLTMLPTSIGQLKNLTKLVLWNCRELKELPDSVGDLRQLEQLWITNCYVLTTLPTAVRKLQALTELFLHGCPNLDELPEEIGAMTQLEGLYLQRCPRLHELPTSIARLPHLTRLEFRELASLDQLPTQVDTIVPWIHWEISRCERLREISGHLVRQLQHMKSWTVDCCANLSCLPPEIGSLSQLEKLRILNCPALELPSQVRHLPRLWYFQTDSLTQDPYGVLSVLPPTLREMDLSHSNAVDSLDDLLAANLPPSLRVLNLNFTSLEKLPRRHRRHDVTTRKLQLELILTKNKCLKRLERDPVRFDYCQLHHLLAFNHFRPVLPGGLDQVETPTRLVMVLAEANRRLKSYPTANVDVLFGLLTSQAWWNESEPL